MKMNMLRFWIKSTQNKTKEKYFKNHFSFLGVGEGRQREREREKPKQSPHTAWSPMQGLISHDLTLRS